MASEMRRFEELDPEFRYYELQTIQSPNRLVHWFINTGMRRAFLTKRLGHAPLPSTLGLGLWAAGPGPSARIPAWRYFCRTHEIFANRVRDRSDTSVIWKVHPDTQAEFGQRRQHTPNEDALQRLAPVIQLRAEGQKHHATGRTP